MPVGQEDLRFLLRLWNDSEIMRYAGFAKNWNYSRIKEWYEEYLKRLEKLGLTEIQFVHKLKNGKASCLVPSNRHIWVNNSLVEKSKTKSPPTLTLEGFASEDTIGYFSSNIFLVSVNSPACSLYR